MIEAALDIGVFLDDRVVFDRAVARWRRRVPAYFYLASDGRARCHRRQRQGRARGAG